MSVELDTNYHICCTCMIVVSRTIFKYIYYFKKYVIGNGHGIVRLDADELQILIYPLPCLHHDNYFSNIIIED